MPRIKKSQQRFKGTVSDLARHAATFCHASMTPEQRRERAKKAAAARWHKPTSEAAA